MKKSNKMVRDVLIIGFALFSMFFGAGNIVFPPYLGLGAGPRWGTAFLCYYFADVGLALLAIFALVQHDGDEQKVLGQMGGHSGKLVMTAVILCIGPFLAIPRTAATTYEMTVLPFAGSSDWVRVLTPIVYFGIVLALSFWESKVIDIVGKFLTPTLFIGLLALIIKGLVTPLGPISALPMTENVAVDGVYNGYQTLDVLGALAYGMIIVSAVRGKGYRQKDQQNKAVMGSGVVAAVALFVIYGGLTYLGATASTLYGKDISRAALTTQITHGLLGQGGAILLAIVVALACLTTAIALISTCGHYFSRLSGGRLRYSTVATLFCVFSALVSSFGLEQLVRLAGPALSLMYPGVLALVALSFVPASMKNPHISRVAVAVATVVSFMELLYSGGWHGLAFITHLPLARFGFAWVVPALVGALAGSLIPAPASAAKTH